MATVANHKEFSAMRMVSSSRWTARIGLVVFFIFLFTPIGLVFVPWQQNIRGKGRVTAPNPQDRPQDVDATIGGRIAEVYVQENSVVKKGDPLFKIVDLDPEFRERLERERLAIESGIDFYRQQKVNNENKIQNLQDSRDTAVRAAESEIEAAKEKVRSSEEKLRAAKAKRITAEFQFDRMKSLFEKDAKSKRDLEVAELGLQTAEAEVNGAQADVDADKAELEAKREKLTKITQDAEVKINEARGKISEIESKIAESQEKLQKKEGEIRKAQSQDIPAPVDGTVFRVTGNLGGQIVKSGDRLLTIVPETQSRVVELWVDGNDAPLISKGDPVRIQFEGWPAVQFAGWPSVAIGTFGGHVSFIDATDNGLGQFRIIVQADESDEEVPWPDTSFLRQGVQAKGWVLLRQVSLGYEIWRQLNGFPPVKDPDKPAIGLRSKDKEGK